MEHHANLRYDQAIAEYTRAQHLSPREWRWPYYQALVDLERGEAGSAAEALRTVVRLEPHLAIAWWRLGEAEFKQGHSKDADAAYARAEADPSIAGHARMGRARIAGLPIPRSRTYTPPRDPMIDALADLSTNPVFLIRQAAALDLARDSSRREQLLRRATETNANDPDVVYEMGSLLQQLRRPSEALAYFVKHLDMVDDDQQTLVQIGKCYIDMGRLGEAETTLRRALELGDDAVGSYNLGVVLEQRGDDLGAEPQYRRAIELGPALAGARNNLGALLARTGRPDEAAMLLKDAIRLEPSRADAYVNLAALLIQMGDVNEAARYARLALDLDAKQADAHANLGVALARLGDLPQARRHFEDALKIDPKHASAAANLRVLLSQP
jgi:Flp pilus assembly protein TadD